MAIFLLTVTSTKETALVDSDFPDDQMSPTFDGNRHSLNLENMLANVSEKENTKSSRKYSVMRQKHFDKLLR